jgi:hypothetical protein
MVATGGIILIVVIGVMVLALGAVGAFFMFRSKSNNINNKNNSLNNLLTNSGSGNGNGTGTGNGNGNGTGNGNGNGTGTGTGTSNGTNTDEDDTIPGGGDLVIIKPDGTCNKVCSSYYIKDVDGCCLNVCTNANCSGNKVADINNSCRCKCGTDVENCPGGNDAQNWELDFNCKCRCKLTESECTSKGKVFDKTNCKCITDPMNGYSKVGGFKATDTTGRLNTTGSILTPEDCKAKCDSNDKCTGFIHSTASQTCDTYKWFRNLDGNATEAVGTLYNKNSNNVDYNDNVTYKKYPGLSMDTGNLSGSPINVDNKNDCENICNSVNTCGGFLHNNTQGKCLLKHAWNKTSHNRGADEWDSYASTRAPEGYSVIHNFEPSIGDIKLIDTDDPVLCAKECNDQKGCMGILTYPDNNGCRLKGDANQYTQVVIDEHSYKSKQTTLHGTYFLKQMNPNQNYTEQTDTILNSQNYYEVHVDNPTECKDLCSTSTKCKGVSLHTPEDVDNLALTTCRLHKEGATGISDTNWISYLK